MRTAHICLRMLASASVICVTATGCATWHGPTLASGEKLQIAVRPVESDVNIRGLGDIYSLSDNERAAATNRALVLAEMTRNTDYLTWYFHRRLGTSPYFAVVPFGATNEVQAILVSRIGGYGRIKKRWLVYLIGSGVIEAVVQGVVAAQAVNNTWVGAAVVAEEIAQEVIIWGGGTYVFNRVYSPVILETELVRVSDGKTMWSHTSFIPANKKGLENYPTAERMRKEVRLRVTAEKAVAETVNQLNNTARRHVAKPNEP